MPKVTVLMAAYNAADTIRECVQSILDQTYQDFKLIVLNDLSTDNTVEIIESFESDKIEIINLQTKGYINALNTGLAACDTEYIARMDADDIMFPQRLEKQVAYMNQNKDAVACGSYVEVFGKYSKIWKRFSPSSEQVRRNMFWFNSVNNPSSMVRNEIIKKHAITYDHKFPVAEDYKFWSDIIKYGKIANISEVLLYYRVHKGQSSKVNNNEQFLNTCEIRQNNLNDFASNYIQEPISCETNKSKIELYKILCSIKVNKQDKWHLAMSKYMLIQSTPSLKFWRFIGLVFTSNFIWDRNSLELVWKMIRTKWGADEKSLI